MKDTNRNKTDCKTIKVYFHTDDLFSSLNDLSPLEKNFLENMVNLKQKTMTIYYY